MDADGIALAFWICVGLFVLLVAAGGIEWFLSRPSRTWLRRLRNLERARVDWSARVVRTQAFYGRER